MLRTCLILVGISALGCHDHDAGKPAQGSAAPAASAKTTPDPTPSIPGQTTPGVPTQTPGAVPAHDQAWKDAMTGTIKAVAPDLTDVTCGDIDCSATLTAATEDELVARAEKLQGEDSLKQLDARGVLLSAPTKKDGKVSMTVRVLFDQ